MVQTARKGYAEEYQAKKILEEQFGKGNVIKVAIGGASDYLVVRSNSPILEKVVEVKGCHERRWYQRKRYEDQLGRILSFCREHGLPFELWVKKPREPFEVRKEYQPEGGVTFSLDKCPIV